MAFHWFPSPQSIDSFLQAEGPRTGFDDESALDAWEAHENAVRDQFDEDACLEAIRDEQAPFLPVAEWTTEELEDWLGSQFDDSIPVGQDGFPIPRWVIEESLNGRR